jgi:hypothetical protein
VRGDAAARSARGTGIQNRKEGGGDDARWRRHPQPEALVYEDAAARRALSVLTSKLERRACACHPSRGAGGR